LFASLLPNGGVGENFRGGEVGKNSGKLQMLALRELARKAFHVRSSNAQPVHSCIDFQMKRNALFAVPRCCAVEHHQLFAAMNHGSEVVLHEPRFFSGHKARQDQNRLSDARLANRNPFVRARHPEPFRTRFFQRQCHFRPTVPVAVAFHNREDFARRLAFLLGRIHVFSNGLEILRQGGKRDFGPHGPAHFFARTILRACHGPSE
jgi:hypothetical protein